MTEKDIRQTIHAVCFKVEGGRKEGCMMVMVMIIMVMMIMVMVMTMMVKVMVMLMMIAMILKDDMLLDDQAAVASLDTHT